MTNIAQLLGDKADNLLNFKNPKIPKERLHVPGPDFVDRIFKDSDRSPQTMRSLQAMYVTGPCDCADATIGFENIGEIVTGGPTGAIVGVSGCITTWYSPVP